MQHNILLSLPAVPPLLELSSLWYPPEYVVLMAEQLRELASVLEQRLQRQQEEEAGQQQRAAVQVADVVQAWQQVMRDR